MIGSLPLGFAQPLVLLGLLSLPILWWLLRLVPPRPRRIDFPPTRLLFEIAPKEETPSRTPWWLTLLRLTLAALVIIAAAGPMWNPRAESRTEYSEDLGYLAPLKTLKTLTFGYTFLETIRFYDVGLDKIQSAVESGRLEKGATISNASLKAAARPELGQRYAEAIRTRTQALHEASYKLAEVVYQNTGGSGSAEGGATSPDGEAEEEVIEDAEIVDEGDHARS